ncbi:MAG: 50S ribosomal protein L17 [Bacteroidetes bacterium]|nr:MAG: 50S ribosomal protein L17 [Bacteroidota bacterium]
MRHGKKINHLGRKSAHRKAMLSNMATSLILHKRISTTLAKAKALRIYVEPLITRSKEDSTHSRRLVFSYLQSKEAVSELFREVSQKVAERPGGYTRILKTGNRLGDNADMCIVELVDYNETMLSSKEPVKAKATRRHRVTKKAASEETKPAKEIQPEVTTEEKAVKKPRKTAKKEPAAEAAPELPLKEETEEPKE